VRLGEIRNFGGGGEVLWASRAQAHSLEYIWGWERSSGCSVCVEPLSEQQLNKEKTILFVILTTFSCKFIFNYDKC